MDKTLNDILDEKRIWIEETVELRRRLQKAQFKNEKLYTLWLQGNDEMVPIIEDNERVIAQMEEMVEEYEGKIKDHRNQLLDYINSMGRHRGVKYAKPTRLKEKYRKSSAEDIFKEIRELIENRRVPERTNIRKGRAKYVKINKVQN